MGEAGPGVGFGSFTVLASAGNIAGDLQVVGCGDKDDAIEAVAELAQERAAISRGTGIAFDFKNQGGDNNGDGGGIASEELVGPRALGFNDGRVNNRIEFAESVSLEGKLGEARAIEPAISGDDFGPKEADDFVVGGLVGFHERAAKLIGFDDVGSVITKHLADGAFPGAETACKSDAKHDVRGPGAFWQREPC